MSILEIFIIGLGLSMDAFAVSICKGLTMTNKNPQKAVIAGLYFGIFQGAMPLIGFFLGSKLTGIFDHIDHWIVFVLLSIIGLNMIRESLDKNSDRNPSFGPKEMFPLAIATSIDALAVGVSFAFLDVNILTASSLIAGITFLISVIGVEAGRFFGVKYKSRAEFVGGLILIVIGIKILVEHIIGA